MATGNGGQTVRLPAVVTLERDDLGEVYVARCLAVEVASHQVDGADGIGQDMADRQVVVAPQGCSDHVLDFVESFRLTASQPQDARQRDPGGDFQFRGHMPVLPASAFTYTTSNGNGHRR